MFSFPIVPILLIIPVIGIFFVLFSVDVKNFSTAKMSALWTSIINFLISLYIPINFDPNIPHFQFVNSFSWFNNDNLKFAVGIDGISLPFVILSTFLIPLCIYFMWNIEKKKNEALFILFSSYRDFSYWSI